MAEIFISHSRRDESQRDWLRSLFGDTQVRAICKEFDEYKTPPWADIAADIERAKAVFLLLTPAVQSSPFTVNWVSFEVTKALASGKALWIMEEVERLTTFPVPGIHPNLARYLPYSRSWPDLDKYVRMVIRGYEDPDPKGPLALGGTGAIIGLTSQDAEVKALGWGIAALGALGFWGSIPQPPKQRTVRCPYPHCGVEFELHAALSLFPCPSCRQGIQMPPSPAFAT